MNAIFDNYGGRKFFIALIVILLSAGLVVFGFVGESNYTTIILGVVGIYIGGNVAQKTFTSQPQKTSEAEKTAETES